jgi:alkylhydroperoxidase/carboxymuconolactone decarboxylase family protein YurZ
MGLISDNFQTFTESLGTVDATLAETCPFDKKVDELMRFALSIKARSKPCVRKHYRGSIAAGANQQELAYVFALTMREAAGADECWTAAAIGDLVDAEVSTSNGSCG